MTDTFTIRDAIAKLVELEDLRVPRPPPAWRS